MKQLRRPLMIAALSALAFFGVQATPASAAEGDPVVSRGITIPTFYNPPTTLPSANGTLIRSEPLKLGLRLPGLDGPLPGTATRLMYKSTDSNGQPVAVTGAYIEPSARVDGQRAPTSRRPGSGHHGAGRPVRSLARAGEPARPQPHGGHRLRRLREPRDVPAPRQGHRRGGHRLRRPRRDRPAAHLREPRRRGSCGPRRRPRDPCARRDLGDGLVPGRPVRLQPGRRGDGVGSGAPADVRAGDHPRRRLLRCAAGRPREGPSRHRRQCARCAPRDGR